MAKTLSAHECEISQIFGNEYAFSIPGYQRPYSWTNEQALDLFDDLYGSIDGNSDEIKDMPPYFLGSIVLIKDEKSTAAEVVDGQQRLTTLTLLLSALRANVDEDNAKGLTELIYEKGNAIRMSPDRYRLTLRPQDQDFFQKYVQKENGFPDLLSLTSQLSDSQNNLRNNAILFQSKLAELPDLERIRLAQFIAKSCYLVVVATQDIDSAYRIFSVLNSRGLDLSPTDIFKSEIISGIPEALIKTYTKKWDDVEETLGRDNFSDLFGHIRMMYRKAKSHGTLLKEFKEHVTEYSQPIQFVDSVLLPVASSFEEIRDASYASTAGAEKVNNHLIWLNRLLFTDWIPPALAFLTKHRNDPALLLRFFADLERLSYFLLITKSGINDRIDRYSSLTKSIEKGGDLFVEKSPIQLSPIEQSDFYEGLNGPIYNKFSAKNRSTILLRLDALVSGGAASYDYEVTSVEHVLPQNPSEKSQWNTWFSDPKDQYHWVHRLGNLALLTRRKNSAASNYEFEKKKNAYFVKNGTSPFALTTQVLNNSEWTPIIVQKRHEDLLATLEKHWRLENRESMLATLGL